MLFTTHPQVAVAVTTRLPQPVITATYCLPLAVGDDTAVVTDRCGSRAAAVGRVIGDGGSIGFRDEQRFRRLSASWRAGQLPDS